jgi:threonine dehydrogenase-like Zn-dependent dehydrogenase
MRQGIQHLYARRRTRMSHSDTASYSLRTPDPDHTAREALRLLGPAPASWVPAHEGVDHNVVVVGGGQTGSAFAFALQRAGIGGVSVIDAAA